jgi:8-oxo-dGTP pyrophosphatase MutT (NUDIX family)
VSNGSGTRGERPATEASDASTASPAGRLTDEEVPAIASSTVVLVRDGRSGGGLEVLLLERHLDSDFAGGALVFPGGKVDDVDRELDAARWTGRPLARWQEELGTATEADALGLLVAAVRETFEEAGVLLAHREDGTPLEADDLSAESAREARRRLSERGRPWDWRPWLADEGLVLDLGALALWSWWVTPLGQHKRFDTRFLIAQQPAGQVAFHDDVETTSLRWIAPADALAEQAAGHATIIFPTRRNLQALARFDRASAAWRAAQAGEVDRRRIQPSIVLVDGRPMVQHPHEDAPEPI